MRRAGSREYIFNRLGAEQVRKNSVCQVPGFSLQLSRHERSSEQISGAKADVAVKFRHAENRFSEILEQVSGRIQTTAGTGKKSKGANAPCTGE